ncbi:MAG: tRNA guanosine(34) transglycosylase Tgt [Planctomycetes bacterium]|nr:tRNA guanosine(34) transglycosylase Tgt [Planctomycetota bacterium]
MFKLQKKSKISQARLGLLQTAHGVIKTPFFMPVATQGAVKHVSPEEMRQLGAGIVLANTYHLMLRPGEKLVKKAGGLHKFMGWAAPILTDSGGFQVFSLSGPKTKSGRSLVKLSSRGARFRSHLDGREYNLTPERSLKIQLDLGVDIAVCLDECAALPASREKIAKAVDLTTAWARRAKKYYDKIKGKKPLLFCVIQGGLDKDLRFKSLHDLIAAGFSAQGGPAAGWDGYNIGGLSVGEKEKEMYQVLDYLVPAMPADKPRYLMGVGYPENIIAAVKRGVDMFDCVIPTREGRHGRLFLRNRIFNFKFSIFKQIRISKNQFSKQFYDTIHISKKEFVNDFTPINPESKLPELRNLSKAYLHYLFKINEPLGQRLASLNNLEFYLDFMAEIRYGILSGKL